MKRLVTLAITATALISSVGCGSLSKEEGTVSNGLDSAFQAQAEIAIDEMNASGLIKRFGDGMWQIEFESPNTLSGVKLEFADGTTTAEYKGLSFSVPQTALPIKSMMGNLISVTDELAKNAELTGESTDESISITGDVDAGTYILTTDKDGNLMRFEMPNMKLVMDFSELSLLSDQPSNDSSESTEPTEASEEVTEENSNQATE